MSTPTFELRAPSSVRERILELFDGCSIAKHAKRCLDEGIWDAEQQYRLALRGAQDEVRRALKVRDASGLPKYGQTTEKDEENETVWRQRHFWSVGDYALNIRERREQAEENFAEAAKLREEAIVRFGVDPEQVA